MNSFKYTLTIFSIVILSACSSSKETAGTNQTSTSTNTSETTTTENQAQEMNVAAKPDSPDNEKHNQVSGSDIVSKTVRSMRSRLELNETQYNDINKIITSTFTASGYNLDEMYSSDKAREMSKNLISKSKDSMAPLLNEQQNDLLNKLF